MIMPYILEVQQNYKYDLQGRIQDGAFGANAPPLLYITIKIDQNSLIEQSVTIILEQSCTPV